MRSFPIVSLCALVAGTALAQTEFEPKDFNVTEALLENGVQETILIEVEEKLEEVVKRSSPCALACASLKKIFGGNKVYSSDVLQYWSIQQEEVTPTCTFKPTSALEVSTMVLFSRLTQCPFATKSGGHAAFAGASSSDGGITLSLERINHVDVLPNNLVDVGPGNRWYDVFLALEPHNLAVVGGRASAVGVAGLTLGGGISHHVNLRGFACDNVASFQVVTASGLIINATPKSHPSLFWALRGGGNNFGIVTNFKLESFPQGPIWGGDRYHTEADIPAVNKAFFNMATNAHTDGKAAHYFGLSSLEVAPGQFAKFVTVDNNYVEQFPASSPPEILKEYLAIPALQDNVKNRTLADVTISLNSSQPDGHRQIFWNHAFKLDLDFLGYMANLFYSSEISQTPGVHTVSMAVQAISKAALQKMERNGGNALGLKASEGPFFHILLYPVWEDASLDAKVEKMAKTFIDTAIAEAEKRGVGSDYVYMNYAGPGQEVVKGYGSENQQRLKSVAKIYDPTGVFQRLQSGGHKLEGAPVIPA